MEPTADPIPGRSTMTWDVLTAYGAACAKVASWAIISAVLHKQSRADFALFVLARSTLGILNYTSFGLAPAIVRLLAERTRAQHELAARQALSDDLRDAASAGPLVLSYERPTADDASLIVWSNAVAVAIISAVIGLVISFIWSTWFPTFFQTPDPQLAKSVTFALGIGLVLRLVSDAPGAVLQTRGRIAADNVLLIVSEAAWVLLSVVAWNRTNTSAEKFAIAFIFASVFLLALRTLLLYFFERLATVTLSLVNRSDIRHLLTFGILVTVAQLADYLYAPTDFMLINRLIGDTAVAVYAPAVQIDGALLLVTGGLAAVLLPKTAIASAASDHASIRRYFLRGTLTSFAAVTVAAALVWWFSGTIFELWLGTRRTWSFVDTQTILPFVLIHTVVGASGAVGRSVLLGMGRVKPYTIAVLIGGVSNVILSFCFVYFLHLGLRGIIFGTIVSVVGRCAVWQPWYVMRALRAKSKTRNKSE